MIQFSIGKKPFYISKKKLERIVSTAANGVAQKLSIKDKFFDVSFVNESEIKKINFKYRKKNKSTDVISFAFCDSEKISTPLLGEIFICYSVARKNARKYKHSSQRELVFLVVHGLLHLFGFDHKNLNDEKKMFVIQKAIMEQINILK